MKGKPTAAQLRQSFGFYAPSADPNAARTVQAFVDGLDAVARQMEEIWGEGRLVRLVKPELADKFWKQMAMLNKAIEANDPQAVEVQAKATERGWHALDRAARADGHQPKSHPGLEIRLKDGRIAAIVPDGVTVLDYRRDGSEVIAFTEAEIGLILSDLLSDQPVLAAIKKTFPGARFTALAAKSEPDWEKGDDIPF